MALQPRFPAKHANDALRERDGAPPPSHLDWTIAVTGRLETEGQLTVCGKVRGRIDADRVVLGRGGLIEGDIVAREAYIDGRFEGRIFAYNVTLADSADVTGRIFHHVITVETGARVDARMPWRPINYFETLDQLPETQS